MKIGIMTIFKTGNYGGVLQAYALKKVIENNQLGDASLINYSSKSVEGKISLNCLLEKGLFHSIIFLIEKIYHFPRMKKMRTFYQSLTNSPVLNQDDLPTLNSKYDIFLSGSDQIWNLKLHENDSSYFLDFVKDPTKKRSYGSSFGTNAFDLETQKRIQDLLKDYHKISIREQEGKDLIFNLLHKDVPIVLDPTLLLDKEQWNNIIPKYDKKNYIFCYQMGHSNKIAKIATIFSKYSKISPKKSIIFVPFPICGLCNCTCKFNFSALEWLAAIKNSSLVLTDSFHGIVFSIIFEKDFYYVITSDTVKDRIGRVLTLLKKLNLENRVINSIEKNMKYSPINYNEVTKLLEKERKESINVLKWILS